MSYSGQSMPVAHVVINDWTPTESGISRTEPIDQLVIIF